MKIQSEERQAERSTSFERERIHRGFALEVLRQMTESEHQRAAERLSEIAELAITPSIGKLEQMAADSRLGDAEIVEPGARLPSQRARKTRKNGSDAQ